MKTIIISSSTSSSSKSFILCKEVLIKLKERNIDCDLLDVRDLDLSFTYFK